MADYSAAEAATIAASTYAPLAKGIAAGFAALAVGFIGTKAAEGVSRNPAAATGILVQSILGMALAEGLGLVAIFMIK